MIMVSATMKSPGCRIRNTALLFQIQDSDVNISVYREPYSLLDGNTLMKTFINIPLSQIKKKVYKRIKHCANQKDQATFPDVKL